MWSSSSSRNCLVNICLLIPAILFLVSNEINRFGQLKRKIAGISKQMLTKQLRELEEDHIINREIFAEIPPRVEYIITPEGKTLLPVIHAMRDWGETQLKKK